MWLRNLRDNQAIRFAANGPIRVGVVGAGFVSSYHLSAIRRVPGTTIEGIADLIPERAEQQAKRFGISRWHSSLDQLLEQDFDVLHVATPALTHHELALAGLRAYRHVIVEKPFTRSVAEADELAVEAERRGRRILVDHSLRGEPRFLEAMRLLECGAIGEVLSVQFFRCGSPPQRVPKRPPYPEPGDPLREVGIHAMYCVHAILGTIRQAHLHVRTTSRHPDFALDEWNLNLECERGLANIHLTWSGPAHQVISVRGSDGQLRLDLTSGLILRRTNWPGPRHVQFVLNPIAEAVTSVWHVGRRVAEFLAGKTYTYRGIHEMIHAFYRCLRAGDPMPISYDSVRNVIDWMQRLTDSIERPDPTHIRSNRTENLAV